VNGISMDVVELQVT